MNAKKAKKIRKQEKMKKEEQMKMMKPSADQLKRAGEELLEHAKDLYGYIHALMDNKNEPTGDLRLTVTKAQGAALLAVLVDQIFSATFSEEGGHPFDLAEDLNGRSALFLSAEYDMHKYLRAKEQAGHKTDNTENEIWPFYFLDECDIADGIKLRLMLGTTTTDVDDEDPLPF